MFQIWVLVVALHLPNGNTSYARVRETNEQVCMVKEREAVDVFDDLAYSGSITFSCVSIAVLP